MYFHVQSLFANLGWFRFYLTWDVLFNTENVDVDPGEEGFWFFGKWRFQMLLLLFPRLSFFFSISFPSWRFRFCPFGSFAISNLWTVINRWKKTFVETGLWPPVSTSINMWFGSASAVRARPRVDGSHFGRENNTGIHIGIEMHWNTSVFGVNHLHVNTHSHERTRSCMRDSVVEGFRVFLQRSIERLITVNSFTFTA